MRWRRNRWGLVFGLLVASSQAAAGSGQSLFLIVRDVVRTDTSGQNPQTVAVAIPHSFFLDVAVEPTGRIYVVETSTLDGSSIRRIDPGLVPVLVASVPGFRTALSVAIDEVGAMVYYGLFAGEIRRCGRNGESPQVYKTGLGGAVWGLDADPLGGKLYWTEVDVATNSGRIVRAGLQFGEFPEIIVSGLHVPIDISVDGAGGKVYWVDATVSNPSIHRANLDGSNVETVVVSGLNSPSSISVDSISGKLYWVDSVSGNIERANLDGTGRESVTTISGANRIEFGTEGLVPVRGKNWGQVKTMYR